MEIKSVTIGCDFVRAGASLCCDDMYDGCDCGGAECDCPDCFSCNACHPCIEARFESGHPRRMMDPETESLAPEDDPELCTGVWNPSEM